MLVVAGFNRGHAGQAETCRRLAVGLGAVAHLPVVVVAPGPDGAVASEGDGMLARRRSARRPSDRRPRPATYCSSAPFPSWPIVGPDDGARPGGRRRSCPAVASTTTVASSVQIPWMGRRPATRIRRRRAIVTLGGAAAIGGYAGCSGRSRTQRSRTAPFHSRHSASVSAGAAAGRDRTKAGPRRGRWERSSGSPRRRDRPEACPATSPYRSTPRHALTRRCRRGSRPGLLGAGDRGTAGSAAAPQAASSSWGDGQIEAAMRQVVPAHGSTASRSRTRARRCPR
jgi:hypothetical protein